MPETESNVATQAELDALDAKLKAILPEEYEHCYEDVQPVSMGSAGLKFDAAGRVAWDEIWGSFCDLAMAGGPPHKGTLLEPASAAQIEADPVGYRTVVDEICRGIRMVCEVAVEPSPNPGWVRVTCPLDGMAPWLTRAIVMENVSAFTLGDIVELPAGPHYRLEKEIKNVITSIAKTSHYFDSHLWSGQQRTIAEMFAEAAAPLLQPTRLVDGVSPEALAKQREAIASKLTEATGLPGGGAEYFGWVGLECPSVRAAIWMMRALVVGNALARREGQVLYLPVDVAHDPDGERLAVTLQGAYRLAAARGLLNAGE